MARRTRCQSGSNQKISLAAIQLRLDLSAVSLSANAISQLVANLEERNIRILGIEGIDPAKWQVGLPSVLRGGRTMRSEDPEEQAEGRSPPGVTPQKQEPWHRF